MMRNDTLEHVDAIIILVHTQSTRFHARRSRIAGAGSRQTRGAVKIEVAGLVETVAVLSYVSE